MRKFSFLIALTILLFVLNCNNIKAENNFSIFLNDNQIMLDESLGKPFAEYGRTFVPIRFMGNVLNFESIWDQESKSATITNGYRTIVLGLNQTNAIVDGNSVSLDASGNIMTQVKNSRIYVPLRFISESMGVKISYEFDKVSGVHNIYLYSDEMNSKISNDEGRFDEVEFREEFLKLVNEERIRVGAKPLIWDENLKDGTDIRADELGRQGKIEHKRPDGRHWKTAFGDVFRGHHGENLIMSSGRNFTSKSLAEFCFNKWKGSEGHYKNMIREDFYSNWISVYINDDNMVAVNIFNGKI